MPETERLTHVWMIMRTHYGFDGHQDDRWDDGVVYATKEAAEAEKAHWDARQQAHHEKQEDENQRVWEAREADLAVLVAAGRRPPGVVSGRSYQRSLFRSYLYVEAVELSYGEL